MLHPRSASRRAGFTLAELIIVMMIIVLLLSILLPALNSARERARKVAAKTQLANMVSASESYILAFNAPPGYASDAVFSAPAPIRGAYTSTENWVVSMLGRVTAAGSTGGTAGVDYLTLSHAEFTGKEVSIKNIGSGPVAGASGRVYGAFYSPKPNELATVTGTIGGSDNQIPEIVDPNTGAPVLYYRQYATTGKPVHEVDNPAAGPLPPHQFTWGINADYIYSAALVTPSGNTYNYVNQSLLSGTVSGSFPNSANNLAWVAIDQSLSSTSAGTATSANDATDIVKGTMLFISAGPDGIPMNKDQVGKNNIDRTTDLDLLDDLWVSGG